MAYPLKVTGPKKPVLDKRHHGQGKKISRFVKSASGGKEAGSDRIRRPPYAHRAAAALARQGELRVWCDGKKITRPVSECRHCDEKIQIDIDALGNRHLRCLKTTK